MASSSSRSKPAIDAEPILESRALAHQFLRGVGVVPEIGVFGLGVQFGEAARRRIDVKDASSAVPTDCLICSTSASASARMVIPDCAKAVGGG